MAVEKRLKPAVIVQVCYSVVLLLSVQNNSGSREKIETCSSVQGMLFCGAAQFRNNSGSREKITCSSVQGMLFCGAASSQFRNNRAAPKIKTCSYKVCYSVVLLLSVQNNSGSREKIKTCSYCTRYVILWCCSLSVQK